MDQEQALAEFEAAYESRIAALRAENERLKTALHNAVHFREGVEGEIERQALREALQEITEVDPETQIDGVSSYLYAWEQCHTIAREALAKEGE